jgi:hypothetical protein
MTLRECNESPGEKEWEGEPHRQGESRRVIPAAEEQANTV